MSLPKKTSKRNRDPDGAAVEEGPQTRRRLGSVEVSVRVTFGTQRPSVQRVAQSRRLAQALPLGTRLVGVEELHKAGLKGADVRVAVIDSGVDKGHPGFNGKVVQQKWFRYGTPLSIDDHGTHVAGTIHFMAPEAKIFDYRVFGESGSFSVDEAIATSIIEACFDGCHVINMSLGGRWPSAAIRTAVEYAVKRNVLIVCAAGNEGDGNELTNERSFPAMWPETISISAVHKEDELPVAKFSNSNPCVDFAAPGVHVWSMKPGGGYQAMSGTSMAAPHICGLIAAVLQDPKLREVGVCQFRKQLEKWAIDIFEPGFDNATGFGFLTYLEKPQLDKLLEKLP